MEGIIRLSIQALNIEISKGGRVDRKTLLNELSNSNTFGEFIINELRDGNHIVQSIHMFS